MCSPFPAPPGLYYCSRESSQCATIFLPCHSPLVTPHSRRLWLRPPAATGVANHRFAPTISLGLIHITQGRRPTFFIHRPPEGMPCITQHIDLVNNAILSPNKEAKQRRPRPQRQIPLPRQEAKAGLYAEPHFRKMSGGSRLKPAPTRPQRGTVTGRTVPHQLAMRDRPSHGTPLGNRQWAIVTSFPRPSAG